MYGVDGAVSVSQQIALVACTVVHCRQKDAASCLVRTLQPALNVCAGDAAAVRQKSDKAETPGDRSAQGKQHH